jgi:hypothetical protein
VHELLGVGDVADAYRGERDGAQFILKVGRVPGTAEMLQREFETLQHLHIQAADYTYRHYYPKPVENGRVTDGFLRQINVFEYTPTTPYATLAQVIEMYPEGLPGRQFVWIFKRMLVALAFAHRWGVVHGCVTPENFIINEDHLGHLVGWTHACRPRERIQSISAAYRDLYPQEVFDRQPASPQTDLFMAGMTMKRVLGPKYNSLDSRLKACLNACLQPHRDARPDDTFAFHDALGRSAGLVYGQPKFVPLNLTRSALVGESS